MNTTVIKYVETKDDSREASNAHYLYCWERKIPHIQVKPEGRSYSKIEYELLTAIHFERSIRLNYFDHIEPLYQLYKQYSALPEKKSFIDRMGGSCTSFTVHRKDAHSIAEKLFDLLILLLPKDQELFLANPILVNSAGYNPENTHVENFTKGLKKMTDDELKEEHFRFTVNNAHWINTIALIEAEMTRRDIPIIYYEVPIEYLQRLTAERLSEYHAIRKLNKLNKKGEE